MIENKYVKIVPDAESNSLEVFWSSKTEFMDSSELIYILETITELVTQYKPQFIINNFRNFKSDFDAQVQNRILNYYLPKLYDLGIRKIAFILPSDVLSALSIELVLQNFNKHARIENRTFETLEKAKAWIKE